jgi:hypothetical protein
VTATTASSIAIGRGGQGGVGTTGTDGAAGKAGVAAVNGGPLAGGTVTASGVGAVALGSAEGTMNGPQATGDRSMAIGSASATTAGPAATSADSIAMGTGARTGTAVTNTNAVAIGTNANANGVNAVAIGNSATATGINSVAIGNGATAGENQIVLGGTTDVKTTVRGNLEAEKDLHVTGQIRAASGVIADLTATTLTADTLTATTLTATTASVDDTLAVTGATTLSSTLGVTGLTTLSGGLVATVTGTAGVAGIAVTAVNGVVLSSGQNALIMGPTGPAQLAGSLAVTGNISTDTLTTTGNATVGGNLDMTNGQIRNLANGTAPGDAVNLGQLESTRKSLSHGIASTAAMANIPLVDPGKTFALGVGVGSHGGQGAFAVGGSYRFNATTVIRGSVAGGGTGKTSAGVGVGFSW